jgi:hypothetical protein
VLGIHKASHDVVGEMQKQVCGHGQGFKQDVELGWLGDYPSAQAVKGRVKSLTYDNSKEFIAGTLR